MSQSLAADDIIAITIADSPDSTEEPKDSAESATSAAMSVVEDPSLESEPDYSELLANCKIWFDQRDHQKIVDSIEAIPEDKRSVDLNCELGRAYNNLAQLGDKETFQKALKCLKPLEPKLKQDFRWNYRIAYTYYHLEQEWNALAYFQQALMLRKHDQDTIYFIHKCFSALGAPEFAHNFASRVDTMWEKFTMQESEWRERLIKNDEEENKKVIEEIQELVSKALAQQRISLSHSFLSSNRYIVNFDLGNSTTLVYASNYLVRRAPKLLFRNWEFHVGHPANRNPPIDNLKVQISPENVLLKMIDAESMALITAKQDAAAKLPNLQGGILDVRDDHLGPVLPDDLSALDKFYNMLTEGDQSVPKNASQELSESTKQPQDKSSAKQQSKVKEVTQEPAEKKVKAGSKTKASTRTYTKIKDKSNLDTVKQLASTVDADMQHSLTSKHDTALSESLVSAEAKAEALHESDNLDTSLTSSITEPQDKVVALSRRELISLNLIEPDPVLDEDDGFIILDKVIITEEEPEIKLDMSKLSKYTSVVNFFDCIRLASHNTSQDVIGFYENHIEDEQESSHESESEPDSNEEPIDDNQQETAFNAYMAAAQSIAYLEDKDSPVAKKSFYKLYRFYDAHITEANIPFEPLEEDEKYYPQLLMAPIRIKYSLSIYCDEMSNLLKENFRHSSSEVREKIQNLVKRIMNIINQKIGECTAFTAFANFRFTGERTQFDEIPTETFTLAELDTMVKKEGFTLGLDSRKLLSHYNLTPYWVKPNPNPDEPKLRREIFAGWSMLPQICNEYLSDDTAIINMYHQNGITMGFISYEFAPWNYADRNITKQRCELQKRIINFISHNPNCLVIGSAFGLYHDYIDFICYGDIRAVQRELYAMCARDQEPQMMIFSPFRFAPVTIIYDATAEAAKAAAVMAAKAAQQAQAQKAQLAEAANSQNSEARTTNATPNADEGLSSDKVDGNDSMVSADSIESAHSANDTDGASKVSETSDADDAGDAGDAGNTGNTDAGSAVVSADGEHKTATHKNYSFGHQPEGSQEVSVQDMQQAAEHTMQQAAEHLDSHDDLQNMAVANENDQGVNSNAATGTDQAVATAQEPSSNIESEHGILKSKERLAVEFHPSEALKAALKLMTMDESAAQEEQNEALNKDILESGFPIITESQITILDQPNESDETKDNQPQDVDQVNKDSESDATDTSASPEKAAANNQKNVSQDDNEYPSIVIEE